MKRIIIAIMVATVYLTSAFAQDPGVVTQDSTANTGAIEYVDTPDSNPGNTTSGTVTSDYEDDSFFSGLDPLNTGLIISVVAIIMIFGLPVFIVFIAFYFRYRNKRAKYKLAEQALAAGQPIPDEFLKAKLENSNVRSKGINNIFTGIGLFIFLWAITGKFALGCIGLLVMFTGFGQLVAYYVQQKDDSSTNRRNDDRNSTGKE